MSIILRPILTERSTKAVEGGKFTFEVRPNATKNQIARAVEATFNVTVKAVWTSKLAGKKRRFGRFIKRLSDRKKATVELEKGQTIDLFATEKKKEKKK